MIGPLRKVLVKRPDGAFSVAAPVKWGYAGAPDLPTAQLQHDAFVDVLKGEGIEVLWHDEPQPDRADAIFVHDPAIVTESGAVVLRIGKELRRGEEASLARRLEEVGVPIISTLHGEAIAEGGDLLWIDHDTLAVGQGFRTNAEGLRQLRDAVRELGSTLSRCRCHIIAAPVPAFT